MLHQRLDAYISCRRPLKIWTFGTFQRRGRGALSSLRILLALRAHGVLGQRYIVALFVGFQDIRGGPSGERIFEEDADVFDFLAALFGFQRDNVRNQR